MVWYGMVWLAWHGMQWWSRNKAVVCKPNIDALLRATAFLADKAVTALLRYA